MARHVVSYRTNNGSTFRIFDNIKDAESYAGAMLLHMYRAGVEILGLNISSPCACCNKEEEIYKDNLCKACWTHQYEKEREIADWYKDWS